MVIDAVEHVAHSLHAEVSLDEPIGIDGEETRADRYADDRQTQEHDATTRERAALVARALAWLPPRHRTILLMWVEAMPTGQPDDIRQPEVWEGHETLHNIGAAVGLSRERVRELKDEALGWLRDWFQAEGYERCDFFGPGDPSSGPMPVEKPRLERPVDPGGVRRILLGRRAPPRWRRENHRIDDPRQRFLPGWDVACVPVLDGSAQDVSGSAATG